MAHEPEHMYTTVEVAAATRVHPRTIARLIKAGDIRAAQVGGQYRVAASELARILAPGSRTRHELRVDDWPAVCEDLRAIMCLGQGADHAKQAKLCAIACDRLAVAERRYAVLAADSKPVTNGCAPIEPAGQDLPYPIAGALQAMKDFGAAEEAAELERCIMHSPEDVLAELARVPASEAEIAEAIKSGREFQASKRKGV